MGANGADNKCDPMNCYEKYVYYAERYVKGVAPRSTALYQLERKVPGADSHPEAWEKMCCMSGITMCDIHREGPPGSDRYSRGGPRMVGEVRLGTHITTIG